MQNRVFFPQVALDTWLTDGSVDLRDEELTIMGEGVGKGRRYRLTEAVRIVNEVTGTADAHDLIGRVKAKPYLDERKAELMESSLLLGDNAYDVVPGWIGEPIGTFAEHLAAHPSHAANGVPVPQTDEDLLSAYLLKSP